MLSKHYSRNRKALKDGRDNNVFVIMRYGDNAPYPAAERAIRQSIERYGFHPVLAKDDEFDKQLWNNVEFCMENSRYAVVLVERQSQPDFNPNVALELGYMMGRGKRCLILKDHTMPSLPTDIIGALYTSVRLHEPQSIEGAIDQWMERLGHTKPIDLFGGATDVHAKLKRTSMIVDALSSVLQAKAKGGRVVRHAGSLSSLAIPDLDVPDDSDETYREYRKQLITERDRVERLIETGGTLKCLVSPYTHIAAVRLGLIPSEQILQKVVPRYNRLLWALRRFRDCRNFQIAWVHRLPHANLFVMGDKQAFVGSHRPRESGFASTTVVKAPELVRKEIDEFDAVFNEAAAAILRVEKPSQDSLESRRLKASVAERIEECKREIEEIAAKPSN